MKPIDYIESRIENKESIKNRSFETLPFIPGDLIEIDFTSGDFVLIYGGPKKGKTSAIINFVLELAKKGRQITVINTETVMSGYKYSTRLMACVMKEIAIREELVEFVINSKLLDKYILYADELLYINENMTEVFWKIYDEAIEIVKKFDIEIYDATDGIIDSEIMYAKIKEVPNNTIVCLDQINQIMVKGATDSVATVLSVLKGISQIIKEKQLVMFLVSQISTGSSTSSTGELPFGGYSLVAEISSACKPNRQGNLLTLDFTHVREAPPFQVQYTIDRESGLIISGRVVNNEK
jgi:hypothetical protein